MATEIEELPGVAVDPTPLFSEAAASFWRIILAAVAGWLGAHTSLSPEFLNSWQGDTLKIFTTLTMLGFSYLFSYMRLKKQAKARALLAEVVEEKKAVIETLK